VEHDADRSAQVGWKPPDDAREDLDAAGRSTDHDQVAMPV